MSQVVVVTDSAASLPEEMYDRYQIIMVPYYVHFAGRVSRDMVDIKQDEFNAYLSGLPLEAELPKTANPGPGDYSQAFASAAERAKEIISFHMTSEGSGAYQAALVGKEIALNRLKGVRIEVVDTRNVSMCHGWMALQAARASARGANLDDILELVRKTPEFYKDFYALTHNNMKTALRIMANLAVQRADQRLALRLLHLAETAHDHEGWIKASQEEISSMIAASLPTLQRILRRFSDNGYVEIGYGRIRVKDRKALLALCQS